MDKIKHSIIAVFFCLITSSYAGVWIYTFDITLASSAATGSTTVDGRFEVEQPFINGVDAAGTFTLSDLVAATFSVTSGTVTWDENDLTAFALTTSGPMSASGPGHPNIIDSFTFSANNGTHFIAAIYTADAFTSPTAVSGPSTFSAGTGGSIEGIPEPSSVVYLGMVIGGMLFLRRKPRRRS